MIDIKSLYLTAKSSGMKRDADRYYESIDRIAKEDPYSYITQLEYIISSDKGLQTFEEFIKINNISIGSFNDISDAITNTIEKYENASIDKSVYEFAVNFIDDFSNKYNASISMYDNFDDLNDDYFESYYSGALNNISTKKCY